METTPARVEAEPRPIVDMLAVQARMLLTDQSFLDPTKTTEAPLLKAETTSPFAQRNYGLFEAASLRERKAQQGSDSTPFEEKYKTWSDSVLGSFNAEGNKQKLGVLKPILKITNATVDSTDIKKLYDRYFDSNSPSSGIKTFVRDVLVNYEADGKYDMAAIARDRDSLKWVAELFGSTSSEMIDQLIAAEAKLIADPTTCFETLNKAINTVTEPEKKMMGFIYDKEVAESIHAPENGGLPIEGYKSKIQDALRDPTIDNVVISAGTGAGKTTKVPQYIYALLKPGEKIAVTQPRRLPTEELTDQVAKQLGVEVGREVGFKHGKARAVSKDTKLVFTVEGSLLRKLAADPMLEEYNYVMVDEWHERHADTDILVGLLQRAQTLRKQNGKTPLKMVITSATMDRENLTKQLGTKGTASFEVPGKQFTVDPQFDKGSEKMSPKTVHTRATKAAIEMLSSRSKDHHILIFMPGDHQIKDTYDTLLKELQRLNISPDEVVIDKLMGSMTREEQKSAINVKDGKRHIIIATPVAETSLTIDRVDVISSGYINQNRVDENTGLEYLELVTHTKKGLEQQKGRSGRKCDGVWRYLGTKEEYDSLAEYPLAEILRTDLSDKVLLLKKMGLTLEELPLIDKTKIPRKNIARAERRLKDLGAIDASGTITELGKQMIEIPQDIHYSRMLLEAQKKGCLRDAATIAVVCTQTDLAERLDGEERNLPIQALNEFATPNGSDFLVHLRMFKAFQEVGKGETDKLREQHRAEWAQNRHFRYTTLQRIEGELAELLDRLDYHEAGTEITNEVALARCIYEGFKDDLYEKKGTKKRDGRMVPTYALKSEPVTDEEIDQNSVIPRDAQYFVSAGGNVRHPNFVRMNQVVDPSWLTS